MPACVFSLIYPSYLTKDNQSMKCSTHALLLCAASALLGCGEASDQPELAKVTGTVMYKNQPVEGAIVSFSSPEASRAATGTTNAEGKFQLSTFDVNDGAVLGTHTVTVTKMKPGSEPENTAMDPNVDPTAMTEMYNQAAESEEKADENHLLPRKYSAAGTTPLKETVKSGENSFVFTLAD